MAHGQLLLLGTEFSFVQAAPERSFGMSAAVSGCWATATPPNDAIHSEIRNVLSEKESERERERVELSRTPNDFISLRDPRQANHSNKSQRDHDEKASNKSAFMSKHVLLRPREEPKRGYAVGVVLKGTGPTRSRGCTKARWTLDKLDAHWTSSMDTRQARWTLDKLDAHLTNSMETRQARWTLDKLDGN